MEVSALKIKSSVFSKKSTKNISGNTTTSFRGTGKISSVISNQIQRDESMLGKIATKLVAFGKNDGEILNSFVTFVGTAFIAPIFIFYNPFAKEDKETKKYSAWRQPISAVLALLAQVGINKKFENYMNQKASLGEFTDSDLRAKPVDKHLRRILKLQHGKLTKEQMDEKIEQIQTQAFRSEVERNRKLAAEGKLTITDEMLINKEMISDAKDIVKEEFKDEIAKLDKKAAEKFIAEKSKEKAIQNALNRVQESAKKKLIIRELAKTKSTMGEAIIAAEQKIKELAGQADEHLYKQVLDKLKDIQQYEQKMHIQDFKSIKNLGDKFDDILRNVRVKQYMTSKIVNAEAVLKNSIKQYGIVISLLTLPVSCGLLNWCYPIIMEKIMPEAYNKKNKKALPPQPTIRKEVKA